MDDFAWAGSTDSYLHEDRNLVRISSDGGKTVLISDALLTGLNTCPDGSLLFSWIGRGGGTLVNVWRTEANGMEPKQLSFGKIDLNPVCTPDSKQVYYSDPNGSSIMRVPADGSSKPQPVPGTTVPGAIFGDPHVGVSPDGKLLAFVSSVTEPGGKETIVRIALLPLNDAQPHLQFLNPNPHILLAPIFTPDSRALVYPIRVNGVDNLWLQPLEGGAGRRITNFPREQVGAYHFSPDGKTIGMLRHHTESDVVLLREPEAAQ